MAFAIRHTTDLSDALCWFGATHPVSRELGKDGRTELFEFYSKDNVCRVLARATGLYSKVSSLKDCPRGAATIIDDETKDQERLWDADLRNTVTELRFPGLPHEEMAVPPMPWTRVRRITRSLELSVGVRSTTKDGEDRPFAPPKASREMRSLMKAPSISPLPPKYTGLVACESPYEWGEGQQVAPLEIADVVASASKSPEVVDLSNLSVLEMLWVFYQEPPTSLVFEAGHWVGMLWWGLNANRSILSAPLSCEMLTPGTNYELSASFPQCGRVWWAKDTEREHVLRIAEMSGTLTALKRKYGGSPAKYIRELAKHGSK